MLAFYISLLAAAAVSCAIGQDSQSDLHHQLLYSYDASAYPEHLRLSFGVTYHGCPQLDFDSGILTSRLIMKYRWRDRRLEWYPEDYVPSIEELNMSPNEIWTPGIILANGISTDAEVFTSHNLRVSYEGRISWTHSGEFRSECEPNGAQWKCRLRFMNWKHAGHDFTLVKFNPEQSLISANACQNENIKVEYHTSVQQEGLIGSLRYYYIIDLEIEQN